MKTAIKLFGGVEGGGTKTILTIVDENGRVMGVTNGGPTNPWALSVCAENGDGFLLAARRIHDMVLECMKKIRDDATLDSTTCEYQLVAVALCLSGGGTQTAKVRLTEAFAKLGSSVDYQTIIANDTLSSLFAACKNGGIVVISGTGSNCILLNPLPDNAESIRSLDELNLSNSGGWGQMLGDEGSAYWISQKCIKYVIDHNDNFHLENEQQQQHHCNDEENKMPEIAAAAAAHHKSPSSSASCSVEDIKSLIFEHFQVSSLGELLPHFYSDFRKDFIASLTVKLAQLVVKNEIVRGIFEDAGYQVARHIVALHPKISQGLIDMPHGLPIVCVGSVFKSWPLIKPGFMRCLQEHHRKRCSRLRELNLVMITENSTIGAAILASKICGQDLADYFVGENARTKLTSQLDHIVINGSNSNNNGADKKPQQQMQNGHQMKKVFEDKSNNALNNNDGSLASLSTTMPLAMPISLHYRMSPPIIKE